MPYRRRLSKTHAGRPVPIDLRPHWLAVTQDSYRNSGTGPMSKVLSVRQFADLDKKVNSFKIMETFSFFIGYYNLGLYEGFDLLPSGLFG